MLALNGNDLTLDQLVAIADDRVEVTIAEEARARVNAARAVVDAHADDDAPTYGINTGFGSFSETRIGRSDLARLQINLLRSHAAGVDAPLPVRSVRASMGRRGHLKAQGL